MKKGQLVWFPILWNYDLDRPRKKPFEKTGEIISINEENGTVLVSIMNVHRKEFKILVDLKDVRPRINPRLG
jgi:hypothetical protein